MLRCTSAPRSKRPAPTSTTVDAKAEAAPVTIWSKFDVRDIRTRFPLRKSGILALLDHHGGVLRAVDALAALFKPEGDYSRGVALAGSLQHDVEILYEAFREWVKRRGVVGLLNRLESAFEVERLLSEMFPEAAALGGEDEGKEALTLAAVKDCEEESELKTPRKTKRKRATTPADGDEDELEERRRRRQRLSHRMRESPEIEIVDVEGEENEAPSTPSPVRNAKSGASKRPNPADLFTPEPEHPRPQAEVYVLVPAALHRRKHVAKYDSDSDREMLRTPTPQAAPPRSMRRQHSKSPAPQRQKRGSSLIQELVCKDNSRLQREMERNRKLTLVEQARERGELRRRAGPLREWNTRCAIRAMEIPIRQAFIIAVDDLECPWRSPEEDAEEPLDDEQVEDLIDQLHQNTHGRSLWWRLPNGMWTPKCGILLQGDIMAGVHRVRWNMEHCTTTEANSLILAGVELYHELKEGRSEFAQRYAACKKVMEFPDHIEYNLAM
ncbi:hypothetical protein MKEN_00483600 [Mycena kentingensis (nom. inval.)]|nr:hypothetical protein MKEN_00483600 [Mycena kentingensis (nom. inval.)]